MKCRVKKKSVSDMWSNIKQSNKVVIGVQEEEEVFGGRRIYIFREIMAGKIFKFDRNCKPTGPRSLIKLKQNTHNSTL